MGEQGLKKVIASIRTPASIARNLTQVYDWLPKPIFKVLENVLHTKKERSSDMKIVYSDTRTHYNKKVGPRPWWEEKDVNLLRYAGLVLFMVLRL